MANKVSELTFEQFVTEVKNYDPDLYAQCEQGGVNIAEILTAHKPTCDALSVRAGVSTARGRLQRELAALTAEYKTGVLLGSTDRYNSRASIKMAMLCQDGTVVELSSFDARAKMDGRKVDIVYPSLAKVMVRWDEKWKTWNVQEFASMTPISREDLLAVLEPMALTPGQVGVAHEKSTVIVKGTISGVAPTAILMYDENEDKYFRDGEFEVLEAPAGPKNADPIPCLGIRIAAERDAYNAINYITAVVGKQRFGAPYLGVSDLKPMCDCAVAAMPEDPREQAIMVADGIKGVIVYAVGYMGAVRQDRNENAENVNYINLNAVCIVETGQFVGADGQVMRSSDFRDEPAAPAPTTTPVAAPSGTVPATSAQAPVAAPVAPAPVAAPAPETPAVESATLPPLGKPQSTAEELASKNPDAVTLTRIRNSIIGFCRVSQLTPDKLTAEQLVPVVLEGKVPEAVIQVVLEDLIAETKNKAS